MDQVLEQRPAPEAIPEIEATLNYFVNDGTKIFTEAAGAGERDKRGGTIDPHAVVIHNGRLHSAEFELERHFHCGLWRRQSTHRPPRRKQANLTIVL